MAGFEWEGELDRTCPYPLAAQQGHAEHLRGVRQEAKARRARISKTAAVLRWLSLRGRKKSYIRKRFMNNSRRLS